MIYLKKFTERQSYWSFFDGDNYKVPNVSLLEDSTDDVPVHYSEYFVKVKYNVEGGVATRVVFNPYFASLRTGGKQYNITPNLTWSEGGDKQISWFFKSGKEHIIEDSVFQSCSAITGVSIPNFVTEIQYGAFAMTGIKEITIPGSVNELCTRLTGKTGEGMQFYRCTALTEVNIENGVKILPYGMFVSCNALESIYLPDSIEEIHDRVFYMEGSYMTSKLKEVRMGKNLKKLGDDVFYYQTGIAKLIMDCDVVPEITSNTFRFSALKALHADDVNPVVYVKDELYDTYLADVNWATIAQYSEFKKISEME